MDGNIIPQTTQDNSCLKRDGLSLQALADKALWVSYSGAPKDDGSIDKAPLNPRTGRLASSTAPKTWGTRGAAEKRAQRLRKPGNRPGVGVVLGDLGNGLCLAGGDLDGCLHGGQLELWAQEIRDRLDSYTEVSPSGRGAKVFFLIRASDLLTIRKATGTKHKKGFMAGDHYGVELHWSNAYYTVTGREYQADPDLDLIGSPGPLRVVPLADLLWLIRDAGPAFLANAGGSGKSRDESGSGVLFRLAQRIKAKGGTEDDLREAVADHPEAAAHVEKGGERAITRAWERSQPPGGPRRTFDHPDIMAALDGLDDEARALIADPMDGLGPLMMRAGRPVSNLHNAICILGRDVESILPGLRHNLMNGRDEWTGGGVTDTDVALVRVALERRGLETISKELVHEAVAAVARHRQFHPIRDYLGGLRHDGTARLDTWLIRHAGAEDSPYTRAVGRAFLISMVARVMQPGCKVDTTLALVGPQGIGKSTLCRVLAGDAYFSDSMPSITGRNSDRDTRAHLRGIWLAEIAEMAATRRSEAEDLKSFMTASTDRIRLPYGRREIEIPRQCVFIGTTNDDQFLTDPTGNRRYWPVTCGEKIDTEGLAAERDQLFAEALAAYRAGERWWFDPEFEAQHVRPVQDAARAPDPWEDEILNWIQTPVRDFDGEHPREEVTIQEILTDALGLPVERQSMRAQKRAGNALRKIGWERFHTRGGKVWRIGESGT